MSDATTRSAPDLPPDDTPVFDQASDTLPFPADAALPMDDDGNILPGNDPMDEDPNDNGDREGADPEDMPGDAGTHLDPNMRKNDLVP